MKLPAVAKPVRDLASSRVIESLQCTVQVLYAVQYMSRAMWRQLGSKARLDVNYSVA